VKKIIGKNQVIITAMAIMIAVAGYLSVTQENAENAAELASTDMEEPSLTTVNEENGVTYDISDEDASGSEGYKLADNGDIIRDDVVGPLDSSSGAGQISDSITTADSVNASDSAQVNDQSGNALSGDNNTQNEAAPDAAQSAAAQEVAAADTQENSKVGEAVLVSGTIGAEYFAQAKLSREQTRSKNKEILMELVNSQTATKEQKEKAVNEVVALTSDSEKENAAETMLAAKGYADSIVSIVDGSADVIVNAAELTQKDIAQIEDIVKRKTSLPASNIVITPVGVQ